MSEEADEDLTDQEQEDQDDEKEVRLGMMKRNT